MEDNRKLSKEELELRMRELGRWFHYFNINGAETKPAVPNHGLPRWVEGQKYPETLIAEFKPYFNFTGKTCLDIGCNSGRFSFELAQLGNKVTGIDIAQNRSKTIDQANLIESVLHTGTQFFYADFTSKEHPALHQRYDIVLFLGVLYHMYHYQEVLPRIKELLNPGGTLFIETAVGKETQFFPAGTPGDPTTFFIPSRSWVHNELLSNGFMTLQSIPRAAGNRLALKATLPNGV